MVVAFLETSHCWPCMTHGLSRAGFEGSLEGWGLGPEAQSVAPICQEVVTGHQRMPGGSGALPCSPLSTVLSGLAVCVPLVLCARTVWMFSSLRVCHSSSVVGKQQDGAMESSQTKGNARPVLRVGWRRAWQGRGAARLSCRRVGPGVLICRPCQKSAEITGERASW